MEKIEWVYCEAFWDYKDIGEDLSPTNSFNIGLGRGHGGGNKLGKWDDNSGLGEKYIDHLCLDS